LKEGRGKYFFPDGRVFEGDYRLDKRHGEGKMSHPNGKVDLVSYVEGTKILKDNN